jgi:hypothetical protein
MNSTPREVVIGIDVGVVVSPGGEALTAAMASQDQRGEKELAALEHVRDELGRQIAALPPE